MKGMRNLCLALSFLVTVMLVPGLCFAGEIDILIEKLVEKGVLSHGEAQEILTETKETVRAELAAGKSASVPKWVQDTKIKGDVRVRYQTEKRKGSGNANERVRSRFRLGLDSKVNEKTDVHFQLATGSRSDARSTNQTWGGNSNEAFGHWDIWIDQAYVDYLASPWLTLMAGKLKLKKAFWETGDILFDTDISPDGASAVINTPLNDSVKFFTNSGWWMLQDGSHHADVTMAYVQPGISMKLNDKTILKLAGGYLQFNSLKGKDLDAVVSSKSSDTNSTDDAGGLKYDFTNVIANAELGIKEPFAFLPFIPYLAVFGDYVTNTDPSDENNAFIVGFKFGEKKVKNFGQWQTKYSYREVEKDAILDILPDSDALGGKTDIKSHEIIFNYGLGKGFTLGLDYYLSERLKAVSNNHSREHLFQADLVYKF
jgi:hypothetical protein